MPEEDRHADPRPQPSSLSLLGQQQLRCYGPQVASILIQVPPRLFPLANVPDNAGEEPQVLYFTHAKVHRKRRAIFPKTNYLSTDADDSRLTRLQVAADVSAVIVAVRRRHQQPDTLTDELALRITKHAFAGRIGRDNDPVQINGDDPSVAVFRIARIWLSRWRSISSVLQRTMKFEACRA